LIGIALGLTVLWVIETQLWPVRANDQLYSAFSATLRLLAKLVPRNTDEDARHPSVESIRRGVEGQLERVSSLLEESRFEPEDVRREAVQRSFPEVQGVFLMLLSLAHETRARRQEVSVDLFRTAETDLDLEITRALEATAEGHSAAFRPNVAAALARLEITADEEPSEKLAIYRRLVLHLNQVSLEPLARTL
jgi:hypothetical protein